MPASNSKMRFQSVQLTTYLTDGLWLRLASHSNAAMARLAEEQIQEFYEQCYTPGVDGDKYRRWRELGAEGKADHVMALVERAGLAAPRSVCEVGCGDGAVLAVLGRRGFGGSRVGYEISASGVKLSAERPEVDDARVFDIYYDMQAEWPAESLARREALLGKGR